MATGRSSIGVTCWRCQAMSSSWPISLPARVFTGRTCIGTWIRAGGLTCRAGARSSPPRPTGPSSSFRAVSSNPESSRLVGVPAGRMLMLGWALAAALGALAGCLVIPTLGLQASSMQSILVFSFAAAALGGFDSPLGAVVGGLIVGVAQSLTTQYIKSLSDIVLVVPFGLILIVLMVRPQGLFGTRRVERV